MPEIGTSGSMSGDGKRSAGLRPQATAPILDFTYPTQTALPLTTRPLTTDHHTTHQIGATMDLKKMMKQAQEMQGRLQQMQEDLAALEVEGQSGGGLVKVKVNGKLEARGLKIDPSLIKPEEAEILEDLIVAAFQDAKRKAEAAAQAKMQELTGGLALPPGLKLF